jgi:acetyltransferase
VLHGPDVAEDRLPTTAIRAYPARYVGRGALADGTEVCFRPIRPEDEPLVGRFHEGLSESSVYMRYFHAMKLSQRVAHERLTRICFIDYDREMALVAEGRDPQSGEAAIFGIGRLSRRRWTHDAEFALLISDRFQKRGLGSALLRRLIEIGRDERLERITADILPQNLPMQRLCTRLGFRLTPLAEEGVVRAEITL